MTILPQESFLICVVVTGSTHSHLPIPNISVQTESSLCNLLWAPLVMWVNLDSALRARDSERPGSLVHRWLFYRLSANFWHPLHRTLEAEGIKKHLYIPRVQQGVRSHKGQADAHPHLLALLRRSRRSRERGSQVV